MRVLAIETSCDETAVALVRDEGRGFFVEESVVVSQIATHAQYGGVVPEVAARMHVPALPPLLEAVTNGWQRGEIDGVAVTAGPGLATALRVGVEAGKALAVGWDVPLVAVDHMEGHIYANLLSDEEHVPVLPQTLFPALCLIVSGGHTELVLMRDHGRYELLGQTRDDAAGEAFDKTAKQLGLPYPGGPSVAACAREGRADAVAFPRPMLHSGDLDMSFSGLKTAVRLEIARRGTITDETRADLCASFQQAVVDVLVAKTQQAVERTAPACVLLCGGVSANQALRTQLAQTLEHEVPVLLPSLRYTTDNAAMIGAVGVRALLDGRSERDPFVVDADPGKLLGDVWKWML